MQGFDVNRFVAERTPIWTRLESLLRDVEQAGISSLNLASAREFGRLYRAVSSDLIRARTEQVNATVVDYLNDIVARAYGVLHTQSSRGQRHLLSFFTQGFPRLFREQWRPIALAAATFFLGAAVGSLFVGADPHSLGALIPDQHQAHTPGERVIAEEEQGSGQTIDSSAAFSGYLFTHNIQVSFVVFALGITWGLGTLALLFYNGVPLGALAMQYHQQGLGTFFWAWILPHGIPEITVVFIAGGAGLIIARGLWLPGRRTRARALVREARTATALVVGGMPILVYAGLIEGTISQIHAPTLAYEAKLAFAALSGGGVYYYLLAAGAKRSSPGEVADSHAQPTATRGSWSSTP